MEFKYSDQPDFIKAMLPLLEASEDKPTIDKKEDKKIESVRKFNDCAFNKVILYPTDSIEDLDALYLKYMMLEPDDKAESDDKAVEIFGDTNPELYKLFKSNIKVTVDDPEDTYTVKDEEIEDEVANESVFTNDLPIFTPNELVTKVEEDYSCFTDKEAEMIKAWREGYALLGNGIKTESYNKMNLDRINILRKAIYENNTDAILQCGWIPGVEFNSENRVKASQLVKEKMELPSIISYNAIEEGLLNQDDIYLNYDKWDPINNNILFITGTAGSGKTTLADKLAKEKGAEVIHLDYVSIACVRGSEWINNKKPSKTESVHSLDKEFVNSNSNLKWGNMTDDEQEETMQMYLEWLVKRCTDKLYIVEGTHIATNPKFKEKYSNRPLIILGVGQLTSYIRKVSRRIKGFNFNTWKRDLSGIIKIATNTKDIAYNDKIISNFRSDMIQEASNNKDKKDKKAVSIILVSGKSMMGKVIKKVQKSEFSHASISIDDDLSRIYSYNISANGLVYESIKGYIDSGIEKIGVYTFLVSDQVYKSIEKSLEKFNLYIDKTKYSILNLLTIPLNIPLEMNMRMVCSQFVDNLLKTANLDLTNKKSSLVGPKDLINAANTKSNIVEVFYGHPKKFKPKEVEKKIKKLKKSNLPIYEFVEYDDEVITEAKSLPIQFDKDGNLLVKNLRRLDFEQEYANSHRLLMQYEKSDSYEPMKFELAKMQFLITLLEKKIYKNGKDKSMDELKVRARYLNDFNKYLKLVMKNEPSFNFTEYYEQSPFNDALIKIDKDTLKFGYKALKYIIKG